MKMLLIALAAFAAAVLFWFCKHHPKFTPGNFPDRQLRWGSGGGFVGKETTYTLLDNGQVFVLKMGCELTEAGSTKPRKAKSLYKTSETLGLATLNFQHPGNTYNFIEVLSGDAIQRITWGDAEYPVDKGVADLFAQLKELVKKEN